MAEIAPFRGILYDPARVEPSRVLAPPYDVIDPPERAALAALDPHNCVRLILPEGGDGDAGGASRYRNAAALLDAWTAEGVLRREARPALYRYHQVFTSPELGPDPVTRRGFIAAVRLHRFDERIILPHERTLSGPKVDRLELMTATRAQFSQIFTLYSDPAGESDAAFAAAEKRAPDLDGTTGDGTRHRLWRVDDPATVSRVVAILAPLRLTIADGHHRYETMLALRDRLRAGAGGALPPRSAAAFGPMFLCNVDDPGLVVLPIHRLVFGIASFSPDDFLAGARRWFEVTPLPGRARDAGAVRAALAAAAGRPSFVAAFPGRDPALLTLGAGQDPASAGAAAGASPAVSALDVSVLHRLVLEQMLGIDRAAQEAQRNIIYVKDTAAALERIAAGEGQVAFLMNATRVAQVVAVAEAGEFMPQKSTFFHPKIASGLVINPVRPDETL
ncbi:MAG TPA: DUF1015 domain-containing protein [Kofleriaceae bacterium]|nr:DUF1015 domain-containing protein [Kofleriaceae bacterium]